jgi:hypothetical protein
MAYGKALGADALWGSRIVIGHGGGANHSNFSSEWQRDLW